MPAVSVTLARKLVVPSDIADERVSVAEVTAPGVTVPTDAALQFAPSCKVTTEPVSKRPPPETVTVKAGVDTVPGEELGFENAKAAAVGGVTS